MYFFILQKRRLKPGKKNELPKVTTQLFRNKRSANTHYLRAVLCTIWNQTACLYIQEFNRNCPITQRRQWHPTPVLLPGKCHGRRSLVGCSPWGR